MRSLLPRDHSSYPDFINPLQLTRNYPLFQQLITNTFRAAVPGMLFVDKRQGVENFHFTSRCFELSASFHPLALLQNSSSLKQTFLASPLIDTFLIVACYTSFSLFFFI